MDLESHPIAKFRKAQTPSLSQEMLAEKLAVTPETIGRWERGETMPPKRYWEKIREITYVTPELLAAAFAQQGAAA